MGGELMIYGSYGYTGALIAREAVARGMRPILAGRNEAKLAAQAAELGLEYRVFPLDAPQQAAEALVGCGVVLHCAGPFVDTAAPMAEACLQAGAHYLDITGEVDVFESLAARGERAKAAGVMILPGVGFDVVPTDCLARHLKERLPDAVRLTLGFYSNLSPSHGTALTILRHFHKGAVIRRNGRLTLVPGAWKTRAIDFGKGPRKAITITWGDVSTAWHSTGIENIEVYMAAPAALRWLSWATRYIGWLLGSGPVHRRLIRSVQEGGPDAAARARGYSLVWGAVENTAGQRAEARMRTPDGYTFTMLSALAIADKVLAGNAPAGFQTPAKAYGADYVLEIPGVSRS